MNSTRPGAPADIRRAAGPNTPSATSYDQLAARTVAGLVRVGGARAVANLERATIADVSVRALTQDPTSVPTLAEVEILMAALWTYQAFYAPRHSWSLVGVDVATATLTWVSETVDLPPVIDVLCHAEHAALDPDANQISGLPAIPVGRHSRGLDLPVPDQPTLRLLILANPPGTRLHFPEWDTTTWEPVKDPVHSLDRAYANPVPHWMR